MSPVTPPQQEPKRSPLLVGGVGSVLGHSGEFRWQAIDFGASGPQPNLVFLRVYRAGSTYQGPLGYGWDFIFNQRLQQSGSNVVYFDGTGRQDTFTWNGTSFLPPAGSYDALVFTAPTNKYTLQSSHGTLFTFDASGTGTYRLSSIKERNGTILSLQYDQTGKLQTITDPLGRQLTIAYNPQGRISTITDWSSRVVSYSYVAGDLVSVRSPTATGFPSGKTTAYGYSTHRLSTITDPKGQLFLQNIFDAQNRVQTQRYGTASQLFQFTYTAGKTTQIDRAGNTVDFEYSAAGNLTRRTQYTRGLRPTDPASFVTTFSYNPNLERIEVVLPDGDKRQFTYDMTNPNRQAQGNLRSVRRVSQNAGDPSLLVSYTYEPLYNLIKTVTDWRSFVTTYYYDYEEAQLGDLNGDGLTNQQLGNVVKVSFPQVSLGQPTPQVIEVKAWWDAAGKLIRVIDAEGTSRTFEYYTSPSPSAGYLWRKTLDPGGLSLVESYTYDAVGNITSYVDPRGNSTSYQVNSLNQVTMVTAPAPLSYQILCTYDANDQLAQVDIENKDENGVRDPTNPFFTKTMNYDVLGNLTSLTEEIGLGSTVTTTYSYDSNENLYDVTAPEGNKTRREWDERDKLFTLTRALATTDETTRVFNYSKNGSLAKETSGAAISTTYEYDGYGRRSATVDAAGGRLEFTYDAANAVTSLTRKTSPGAIVVQETNSFDEIGRLFRIDLLHKDSSGSPVGDGISRTEFVHDSLGNALAVRDDNGNAVTMVLDRAGRVVKKVNPLGELLGSSREYQYDAAGNQTQETAKDYNESSASIETRVMTADFDAMNRQTKQTVDPTGLNLVTTYKYNSRSLLVQSTSPSGTVTSSAFDGLGRLLSRTQDVGGIASACSVTWDGNSRMTSFKDANTNATSFAYDFADRIIQHLYANGTSRAIQYNDDDRVTQITDPSNNVSTLTYSLIGLLQERNVALGAGVLGTTREVYVQDSVGRVTQLSAYEGAVLKSTVQLAYDTLSQVDHETQTTFGVSARDVWRAFDGARRRTSLIYPSGGTVSIGFDAADHIKSISFNSVAVTTYDIVGKWLARKTMGNATKAEFTIDLGGRTSGVNQRTPAGASFAQFLYAFSTDSLRKFVNRVHDAKGDAYRFDGIGSLSGIKYGVPSIQLDPSKTYGDYATFDKETTYDNDPVRNRESVSDGGVVTQYNYAGGVYSPDSMNRYLTVGAATWSYDAGGNLMDDGVQAYSYDYRNRLIRVVRKSDSAIRAVFQYDGFGRRVRRDVDGVATFLFYDGGRVIEEQNSSGSTLATYVYGRGIDEILRMDRAGQTRLFHQDGLGSVMFVTDGTGGVIERVSYDAFGQPTFAGPTGIPNNPPNTSAIGNPLAFTGAWWEPAIGVYQMRARFYSPVAGRFLSRDPLMDAQILESGFNAYTYAEGDPINFIDPLGLFATKEHGKMTKEACEKLKYKVKEDIDCDKIAQCNMDQDTLGSLVNPSKQNQSQHGMASFGDGYQDYVKGMEDKIKDEIMQCNLQDALCDLGKLTHAVQDHQTHHGMGKINHYSRTLGGLIVRAVSFGAWHVLDPDDAEVNPEAYGNAKDATEAWFEWAFDLIAMCGQEHKSTEVTTVTGLQVPLQSTQINVVDTDYQEAHFLAETRPFLGGYPYSPSYEGFASMLDLSGHWPDEFQWRAFPLSVGGFGGVAPKKSESWGILRDVMSMPEANRTIPTEWLPNEMTDGTLGDTKREY